MATIVTRTGKGSALTFAEGDANFTNLNTDKVELTDISVTTGASADTSALAYNNSTGVFTFTPVETSDLAALDDFSVTTGSPTGGGALAYNNTTGVFTFQAADISALDFAALDDFSVTTGAASGAGALSYNNTTGVFTFNPVDTSLVLTEVEEDTAPVLGGSLDVNDNSITTTVTNGDITITANGDGEVVLGPLTSVGKIISFSEEIETLAAVSGTLSIDAADGPIKYVVPSGAMTINGLASPIDGQTATLLVDNATNSSNFGITLGSGLLTPAGDGVTVTDSGYDLVTITCVDATNGLYIVTAINDFQ